MSNFFKISGFCKNALFYLKKIPDIIKMLNIPDYKVKIVIYPNDTWEDIINRLSVRLNTLPSYIDFQTSPPPIDDLVDNDIDVKVIDILRYTTDYRGIEYIKWLNSLGNRFTELDNVEKLQIWLYKKSKSQPLGTLTLLLADEIKKNKIDIGNFDIQNFGDRQLEEYETQLNRKIGTLRERVEKIDNRRDLLNSITSTVVLTPFEIKKLEYLLTTNLTLNPIEFFDSFKVGVDIPFISCYDFYKIAEDFIPPPEWSISKDFLLMKLRTKTQLGIREKPDIEELYSDCIVTDVQESKKSTPTTVKLILSNKNTPQERNTFISTILNSIDSPITPELINSEQTGFSGIFFIPNFIVDNYVFVDLALNDQLFSYYININETVKATKQKTAIYFYFTNPDKSQLGTVTVSIVNKIADKKDIEIRKITDIGVGTNFARINVRSAKSREAVDNFMSIFARLLQRYNQQLPQVSAFYQKYIPEFAPIPQIRIREDPKEKKIIKPQEFDDEKLKEIVPDLFLPGYTRLVCAQSPKIIKEGESLGGKDYIVFPNSPEEGKQYKYWCNPPAAKKEFKYIGLKNNKMKNKDQYPVMPCCFIQNQKEKQNSVYNKYMSGMIKGDKEKRGEQKISKKGLSVLELRGYGGIPDSLNRLFYQIDPRYKYQRYGMIASKSSFLECVLHALNKDNFVSLQDDERYERVDAVRVSRRFMDNAYLCLQQLYDKNISDIQAILKSDAYLDPKLFIHMISQLYQCNIYVFTRKYRERDADILIPRNIYGLYRIYRSDWPSIVIFENYGNEADTIDHPQCELIGRWDQKLAVPSFSQSDKVLKRELEVVYRQLFNQLDGQTNIVLPTQFGATFSHQYVDNFGKTRFLQIRGGKYFIMTSPLSILNIPNIKLLPTPPLRKDIPWVEVQKFMQDLGLVVTGIYVNSENYLQEVKARFSEWGANIDIYIPVEKITFPAELSGVNRYMVEYFIAGDVEFDTFKYNKKIARCITSNLYHIYSNFISSKNYKPCPDNLVEFIDQCIILDEKHQYPRIPPIDINQNNGIIKKDKIILNSEELVKRLLYQLRLTIDRNSEFLEQFRFANKVDGFYQDADDFVNRPNQIIVKGADIIRKWYLINISDFRIYRFIQPQLFTYFLKNQTITGSDQLFIANTRDTLEEGFREFYDKDQDPEFDIIVYQKNQWVTYRVPGAPSSIPKSQSPMGASGGIMREKPRVVAYKLQDRPKYVFIIPY